MTWSYRIVKYRNGACFGLHEVFYDAAGLAESMTTEAVGFVADADEGPAGVVRSLEMALRDATSRPVFDEPETWPGVNPGDGQ